MGRLLPSLNRFVTAFFAAVVLVSAPAAVMAQDSEEIARLLGELAKPDQPGWEQIESSIIREWSKSGSPAMDLLLERGEEALEAGDIDAAIEHFTALTDHAPDFAEGWNARATAFFHADELGLSLADIERTLALNPQHFGALSGLAIILEELGYDAEALEAYRAVESIHPHRPPVKEAIERLEKEVEGARL
ncbi:tetratricopeptide repeat protein [Tropicimonas marinistellae]|uniref:tetratricopeptide repeat protein n=1 Tax=Tropicimonas marinistellae TaxID=1739787 RepID=UPI00122E4DE2|nr:tetratricopeptide repeat protein [Tropicimonas marinistellae]